jgi:hypothetical protein
LEAKKENKARTEPACRKNWNTAYRAGKEKFRWKNRINASRIPLLVSVLVQFRIGPLKVSVVE